MPDIVNFTLVGVEYFDVSINMLRFFLGRNSVTRKQFVPFRGLLLDFVKNHRSARAPGGSVG